MFLSDKLDAIISTVVETPTDAIANLAISQISNIIYLEISTLVEDLKAKHHSDSTAIPIIRSNIKRLNSTVNSCNEKYIFLNEDCNNKPFEETHLLKKNAVILLCELTKYPKQVYEGIV